MFKKWVFVLIAVMFATSALAAKDKNSIQVKGSDTMVNLGQAWAEKYMEKNPGGFVAVTGGGSGTGIAALLNGSTDICNASRPMKQSEIEKLKLTIGEDFGSGYPSDPKTKEFLKKNYKKYPKLFRKSWSSWKDAKIASGQKSLGEF